MCIVRVRGVGGLGVRGGSCSKKTHGGCLRRGVGEMCAKDDGRVGWQKIVRIKKGDWIREDGCGGGGSCWKACS